MSAGHVRSTARHQESRRVGSIVAAARQTSVGANLGRVATDDI